MIRTYRAVWKWKGKLLRWTMGGICLLCVQCNTNVFHFSFYVYGKASLIYTAPFSHKATQVLYKGTRIRPKKKEEEEVMDVIYCEVRVKCNVVSRNLHDLRALTGWLLLTASGFLITAVLCFSLGIPQICQMSSLPNSWKLSWLTCWRRVNRSTPT